MKIFKYKTDQYVIVTENAKTGLPSWVGKMVKIKTMVLNSLSYDYGIVDERGEIVRVKESELTEPSRDELTLYENLKSSNWKCETVWDEKATVVKLDFVYNKAEIKFDDETMIVIDIDKLKVSEVDDTTEEKDGEELSGKELHKRILDEIHDTYVRKNADYGNSFEEQFNEYGLLSAIIRFDDKIRRLKQLNKHEAQVKDESIRDSALDLANYAIMTVMELDKGGK